MKLRKWFKGKAIWEVSVSARVRLVIALSIYVSHGGILPAPYMRVVYFESGNPFGYHFL